MGALGHFLESKGIATSQISLIREHTEIIRPPRALWVPFELGRPLGAPNDPAFQRKVLIEALLLLESSEGPVLAEFADEAPEDMSEALDEANGWACPVSFSPPHGSESPVAAFRREVAELQPWYYQALKNRGHSTVSHFSPEEASELLCRFVLGETPDVSLQGFDLATALRFAAADLKAFYFEAMLARPGSSAPGSSAFKDWFWSKTAAGQLLRTVKNKCLEEGDEALRMVGKMFLVPADLA